jgi:hypothetical protein
MPPEIKIAKVKPRRGTNSARLQTLLDQGEIVTTTDTKRLYVGTGTLSGGSAVGNVIHNPITNVTSLSNVIAEKGDLVPVNNIFYQLTSNNYTNLNNWVNMATRINPIFFYYDNNNSITLKLSSIESSYISPNTVNQGVGIFDGDIRVNYDPRFFKLSGDALQLNYDSVSEWEIRDSALYLGLTGGSGERLTLDVDKSYFVFNGNTLSLSSAPIVFSNLSSFFGTGFVFDNEIIETVLTDVDGITLSKDTNGIISIDGSIFGNGLVYNSNILSSKLADVDYISLTSNDFGVVSITPNALSGVNHWPSIEVDVYGRVINHESSILDVLTGNSALSSFNSNNSLSAIFNGDSMGLSSLQITKFTALSSDGVTVINLSSAGFITFEGGVTTRYGTTVDRFAIPIFRY